MYFDFLRTPKKILCLLGIVLLVFPGNVQAEQSPEERVQSRRARFPVIERARLMVENELLPQKGLENADVIDVMKRIPRNRFVSPLHQTIAYRDQAIAIGEAQTISPPYIVAFMTQQLEPKPTDKVLEIGTGSGYQAAVLSLLVDEVYSIEIVEPLGQRAKRLIDRLGMDNVHIRIGDGYKGWPEAAPFDSIIVTCSPESVPEPLVAQLREGGRMIIPLGERYQQAFYLCRKIDGKLIREHLTQTLFVPMTGQAEEERQLKPDPDNPSIIGGGFEEIREDGSPVGWHYARNIEIVAYPTAGGDENGERNIPSDSEPNPDTKIPEGKQFARLVSKTKPSNKIDRVAISPKRKPRQLTESTSEPLADILEPAQVLQGFAVNGKTVKTLTLEYSLRGRDIVPLRGRFQAPTAGLMLFDEDRNQIAEIPIGRSNGSFDWKRIIHPIEIPEKTREAVLLIGLPSSTGQLDIDNVLIRGTGRTE